MKRIAFVFLLTGTALAGGREPGSPQPVLGYSQLAPLKNAAFDRAFMGWMISRQKVNVTLANSTVYGSQNPAVKAFAEQVKANHAASIAKLRSWGGDQFAIIDIVGPGNDYDRWFLSKLPCQNEQLRQLLRLVPSHTPNTNLHQFAAQLLPRLDAEDARAHALLDTLK